MKRSKNIEFTGRADFFTPIDPIGNWNLLNLDITSSGHVCFNFLKPDFPFLVLIFTPCSEYSLSPIVVGVSSLPTSYMSFYVHLTSIHPSILSP